MWMFTVNFSSDRTAVVAGGTMNTFTVTWSMMDGEERGNAALPQDAAIRVMRPPRPHGIMVLGDLEKVHG